MLELSNIARSTYYYHTREKADKYAMEEVVIKSIFEESKSTYGYRRITLEMKNQGYAINHKTVLKLMKRLELQGKQRKNKYRSYKGEVGKIAPNVLQREFYTDKPYTKLATDVTEFKVCNERVYFSPVIDMYNNEILSYAISMSPNFWQTREMLKGLFKRLPKGANPLLHSDQGWQYQMKEYQRLLKEHGVRQSMSRKGNCLDNSVMENFFGRMKVEMYYGEKFESVNTFIEKLKEYIDYYNKERISLKLKMSPVQYRTHHQYN